MSPAQRTTELRFTQVSLIVTTVATALLAWSTGHIAWTAAEQGQLSRLFEAILFGVLAGFLVYGNLCYQVARLGRLTRTRPDQMSRMDSPAPFILESAPALTVLVPSYKEEIPIIRQTLLSAALQDYPNKRVVLLLDDPPHPKTSQDRAALWAGRTLPFEIQTSLKEPVEYAAQARAAFLDRRAAMTRDLADECVRLSDCIRWTSAWFEAQAKHFAEESHTDVWFVEQVLNQPAEAFREEAARWFGRRKQVDNLPANRILDEIDTAYATLIGRFKVEFDVFERKQYRNLCHEPNKAMNLNSFLGLMGTRVKPILRKDGVYLEKTSVLTGSRLIPDTPYVITLDADSLLLPQYASTLVRLMEQPEHARMAVAQTPYSAFPNPPGTMERTAGATTDIQYLVHQGFTRFGATFWVGANALLRKSALEDICTEDRTSTGIIRRYIQDRTVIEDTESTVDLLSKGWSLYNYPERLAYSATPPDFGSLIIQRARWANGGLIIFPKLLSFLRRKPKRLNTVAQGLLQTHYLTSLAFAPLSVLLLLVIPFSSDVMTAWMPLAALPYFALYARDLALMGYQPMRDLLRVYALNLLLIPVHLGGALNSMQQAIVGTKIPFRRTPKISGRTRTPALYLVLELAMVLLSTALAVYYASQMRWISGTFALANAGLILFGIKQFVGFSEMIEDLVDEWYELLGRYKALWSQQRVKDHVLARLAQSTDWMYTFAPQIRRATFFTWEILWAMIVVLEMMSPAVASGTAREGLNPIQVENRKTGTATWVLANPARHQEIEGYASPASVNHGESIRLYVNTEAPSYRMTIYRMGWYNGLGAREVLAATRRAGHRQPAPYRDPATGLIECHWENPITLVIPSQEPAATDWTSGYYLAKLTAEPTGEDSYILFIVRDDQRPSTYLMQSSVTTFQAYNNWGGASLYDYNSPQGRAVAVTFNRPYAVALDRDSADAAGAGPFLRGWEYNMVRWLERSGYDVSYTTNVDVHERAEVLQFHSAFLSVGHDEYWTWAMRRHVEEARDHGLHLGFFSANTCYWQVRLEPSRLTGERDRTLVAYKERAPWHDPVLLDRDPTNDYLATTKWRSAPVNEPEAALVGGMYLEGSPMVDGDLVIESPPNWVVQGTTLERGAHLPGLLGYEVDGFDETSSPANTVVVARSPVGSRYAASTIYTAPSGAVVFNAGSMQWIWGLDDYRAALADGPRVNPAVQHMTENILNRFSHAPQRISDTDRRGS
jgi:cellulose synthase/poly-beta-1,6-N-acetylglucosamine synthase-like glycosyltransferase